MEGRSRLKERLSRMFRASTLLRSSCNSTSSTSIFSSSTAAASSRTLSTDVAHEPVFIPRRRPTSDVDDGSLFLLRESLDRSLSFRSANDHLWTARLSIDCGSCRPKPERKERSNNWMLKKKKKERRGRETGGFYVMCPPASPSSPLHNSIEEEAKKKQQKNQSCKKNDRSIKKKKLLSNGYGYTSSSSMESDDGFWFFSNNDEGGHKEEETENFFSSRSFSSDSSEFYQRPSKIKQKKKKKKKLCSREGFRPLVSVSRESGFAVMKRSRDPYGDFRSSMVEMIVERQIFGAEELECLLRSYLSLNSPHHHPIILRAFADIWEVLFGH